MSPYIIHTIHIYMCIISIKTSDVSYFILLRTRNWIFWFISEYWYYFASLWSGMIQSVIAKHYIHKLQVCCNMILIVKLTSGYIREKTLYNMTHTCIPIISPQVSHVKYFPLANTLLVLQELILLYLMHIISLGTNIVLSNAYSSSKTNIFTCYTHKFMWLHVIQCLSRI